MYELVVCMFKFISSSFLASLSSSNKGLKRSTNFVDVQMSGGYSSLHVCDQGCFSFLREALSGCKDWRDEPSLILNETGDENIE